MNMKLTWKLTVFVFSLCLRTDFAPKQHGNWYNWLNLTAPNNVLSETNTNPREYVHCSQNTDPQVPTSVGFRLSGIDTLNSSIHIFYNLRYCRHWPDTPIKLNKRYHHLIPLLIAGIEANPGPSTVTPETPKYPCGVCQEAVVDFGQRALACDRCDVWTHKSCMEMKSAEYDNLADTSIPWYCPHCDSLNRSTIIYDVPILQDNECHSSMNSSAMINSTRSTSDSRSSTSSIPSEDPQADLSNSTFSSIGSPVQASSPKPPQQVRKRNIKKSLRILNINFQSARKKSKYISTVIETTKPDIILGTETWLSDDIRSSEVFDSNLGFEVHRNDRPNNPHGGVLIAVKTELNITEVTSSKTTEFISGTLKLSDNKKMVIGAYYRPPSRNDDQYLKDTRSEFESLRRKHKQAKFIIGGDFNLPDISWQNNTIRNSASYPKKVNQHYLDLVSDLDLEQMVSTPTRQNNILDLIFTSHPSFTERCKTLPPISEKSDHDIVLFDVSMQPVRARPKRRTIFLWDKADIQGIKSSLATFRDKFMETNFQTVEQMWQSFRSAVDSAKDKYVPVRKTASRFTHPWINTKLRRLSKRKLRAYKKAKRTGSPADWTRYTNLKTSTQREIRTSHRNYMKGMVT